jgi:hypothetical protein
MLLVMAVKRLFEMRQHSSDGCSRRHQLQLSHASYGMPLVMTNISAAKSHQ